MRTNIVEEIMLGGQLTSREKGLIRELLVEHGITTYEIIEVTNEGRELPGSTYDDEIELLFGLLATPISVYTFVLDCVDGKYTLGQGTGFWRELCPDELGKEKQRISEVQQRLTACKNS